MYKKCQVSVSVLLSQIFNWYRYRFLRNEISASLVYNPSWNVGVQLLVGHVLLVTGKLDFWTHGAVSEDKTEQLKLTGYSPSTSMWGQEDSCYEIAQGVSYRKRVYQWSKCKYTYALQHSGSVHGYMLLSVFSFFSLPWDETRMWKLHLATCALQWLRQCWANSSCSLAFEMGASQTQQSHWSQ